MPGPAGEVLIAGEYTATWSGVSVGMFEGDASCPTISQQSKAEPVSNTSRYGKTFIDGIYQGADWFVHYVCEEYKAGSIAAYWPFGPIGQLGVIARLYSALGAPLVLTAVAGTPAAGPPGAPATISANKTILAPGFDGRLLYGPTLRKVPMRLVMMPYDQGGGVIGWYTQT
jgi:hypothetical protein